MILTSTQNENIYSVYCSIPVSLVRSINLKFLHFNLEEKNEDRKFWNGHHAAVSYDSNEYLPGNVGNGKYIVLGLGALDITLPKASMWFRMQMRADRIDESVFQETFIFSLYMFDTY